MSPYWRQWGLLALAVVPLLSCRGGTAPTDTPDPTHERTSRSLLGTWTIEFTLDSVRRRDSAMAWARSSLPPVRGTLRLSDSTGAQGGLRSTMTVDFIPLLGRQMSCYSPGPGEVVVDTTDQRWGLWFTPGSADCGFGGAASGTGDTLLGTWGETSFIGSVAEGRFRMVRRR